MLKRIVRTKISEDCRGKKLLDFLEERFTYRTQLQWKELLQDGKIALDGHTAGESDILSSGMMLEYFPGELEEPPVSTDIKLLWEDENFLVLDKPGNLPCHPAGCFFNNTLWAILKEGRIKGIGAMEDVHFVSRLDRETSGIVLVAKNSKAHKYAAKELTSTASEKAYMVLVEGDFPEELNAAGWLCQDTASPVSKKRRFSFTKPSIPSETSETSFTLCFRENGMSLVKAVLHTGRTHQIRATLRSLGFPVVGDKIYGVDDRFFLRFLEHSLTVEDKERLRMQRQALHAYSLRFVGHTFLSPVPKDFICLK